MLTRTLWFAGAFSHVGIRGATANSDDVVLIGPGMSQPNYGEVPFGIWAGNGVTGITIANLTIRDFYFHPIILNAGAEDPADLQRPPDRRRRAVRQGQSRRPRRRRRQRHPRYSVIEFTTTGRSDYPKGIDIQTAQHWIVRHNLFKNLVPPSGDLSGPGVLVWRGSRNTTVEGNTFVNCTRGVMMGADDNYSPSQSGGVVRNNVFYRSAGQPGDVGLMMTDPPDTQIVNNTIYLSGTYRSAIDTATAARATGSSPTISSTPPLRRAMAPRRHCAPTSRAPGPATSSAWPAVICTSPRPPRARSIRARPSPRSRTTGTARRGRRARPTTSARTNSAAPSRPTGLPAGSSIQPEPAVGRDADTQRRAVEHGHD